MKTLSALTTLAIGPSAVAQPSALKVRLLLTKSEAEKAGVLNRWETARQRRDLKAQRKATAAVELNLSILKLLQHAEEKEWSQRKLTKEAGLSWGSWKRCRDGQSDPVIWLPKVQAALNRLTTHA